MLPGGNYLVPVVRVLSGVAVNCAAVYSLYTGKMIGRFGSLVEGRESAPVLYWIYIGGVGGIALFLDAYFVHGLWRHYRSPND